MKIAILNKYQNKVDRGAETFVKELSRRLVKEFEVDVISNINYLQILLKKYDVIIPTNGREQVFIIRILSWLTGTKVIVSGQSGLGADDKWNLLCMPDVFVGLTKYQEKWAKRFNPFIKTTVIANGVDLEKFNPSVKPLKIGLPHPVILSVGALIHGKRLELIIKSVSKTNASLLLVGKGELDKSLQEMGDELMPGRVKIISVPHEEMPGVYTACDLFTYSTNPWESFGIVIVEAMAGGLPIVANSDPIREEIVGQAGVLVNVNNVDEYAQAIRQGLSKKWGNLPRKQAEKFSWDEISEKYVKLIKEVC